MPGPFDWRRFASDAGGWTGQGDLYPEAPPVPEVAPPEWQEAAIPQRMPVGLSAPRLDSSVPGPVREAEAVMKGLPQQLSPEMQALAQKTPSGLRMGLATLASVFTPSAAFAPLIAYGPKGLAARQQQTAYQGSMPTRLSAINAIQNAQDEDVLRQGQADDRQIRADQNTAMNHQRQVDAYNRVTSSIRTRRGNPLGDQDPVPEGYTVEMISTPEGRQERWVIPSAETIKRQEYLATTEETPQDVLEAYPDSAKRMMPTAIQGIRSALQRKDEASAQRIQQAALQAERLALQKSLAEMNAANQRAIAQLRVDSTAANRTQRPTTGAEREDLGFYNRAKAAVTALTSKASDLDTSLEERMAQQGNLGQAWMNNAPNMVKSEDQRQYVQHQRTFTEARLRKESGAAIPPQEFESDRLMYFAVAGDTPKGIAEKARARAVVLDGLAFGAGNAFNEYYGEPYQGTQPGARQVGSGAGNGAGVGGVRVPATSGGAQRTPSGVVPRITTKAEYDALPAGAKYVDVQDGQTYTKGRQ